MTRCNSVSVSGRRALALAARLLQSDSGDDLVEYALLTTAIGLVGAAAFTFLSDAIKYAYGTWNAGQQNLWQPPNPM